MKNKLESLKITITKQIIIISVIFLDLPKKNNEWEEGQKILNSMIITKSCIMKVQRTYGKINYHQICNLHKKLWEMRKIRKIKFNVYVSNIFCAQIIFSSKPRSTCAELLNWRWIALNSLTHSQLKFVALFHSIHCRSVLKSWKFFNLFD